MSLFKEMMSLFLAKLTKTKLPSKSIKRGRPKGAEKTTIGLPKKKKNKVSIQPFVRKSPQEKDKSMYNQVLSI